MIFHSLYITVTLTALIIFALHSAQAIRMPIICSALCAMFIPPLIKRLERTGLNLGFSSLIVVTVIIAIVIFGAIGGVVAMILSIPFLVLLKVISFYTKGWKPLRYLLQVQ